MIKHQSIKSKENEAKEPQEYVYVDLSSQYLDAYIQGNYRRYSNDEIEFTKFIKAISSEKIKNPVLVAFESTGSISLYFAECLDRLHIVRNRINPSWIRHYAKSGGRVAKTDKIDSEVIASYAELYKMQADTAMSAAMSTLRQLQRMRSMFIKYRAQLYMSITETLRMSEDLTQTRYHQLQAKGKSHKVAAIASIRHMTVRLNAQVRDWIGQASQR